MNAQRLGSALTTFPSPPSPVSTAICLFFFQRRIFLVTPPTLWDDASRRLMPVPFGHPRLATPAALAHEIRAVFACTSPPAPVSATPAVPLPTHARVHIDNAPLPPPLTRVHSDDAAPSTTTSRCPRPRARVHVDNAALPPTPPRCRHLPPVDVDDAARCPRSRQGRHPRRRRRSLARFHSDDEAPLPTPAAHGPLAHVRSEDAAPSLASTSTTPPSSLAFTPTTPPRRPSTTPPLPAAHTLLACVHVDDAALTPSLAFTPTMPPRPLSQQRRHAGAHAARTSTTPRSRPAALAPLARIHVDDAVLARIHVDDPTPLRSRPSAASMSMTACWPAFPSTTAPCANAASAFTPAPSLALVAHARTVHPRVWVPAPRRPAAPSPPHRARSSPPSRFSPSSSYTPSLRTPDLCTGGVCAMPRPSRRPRTARVILRRAGAVADAALSLLVHLRLRSMRPPTPREDSRVIRGCACAHTPGTCCRWDLQAQRGRHLPVQSSTLDSRCARLAARYAARDPDSTCAPPSSLRRMQGVGAKYLALSPVAVYSRKGMAGVEGGWACSVPRVFPLFVDLFLLTLYPRPFYFNMT
ncbi:hypothetical protein B0H13DRAFT_2579796 [Mycena leptocephala]|nr:hypothetical protein B0H13DRAFT_2579796 [Mycena leptocephala]